jgi:hypothetical protein
MKGTQKCPGYPIIEKIKFGLMTDAFSLTFQIRIKEKSDERIFKNGVTFPDR